jgi:MFS transporter, DHA1 family, multidrug resistance protein
MSGRGIPPSSFLYVVMLGLLSALPPFGTDAGLPGLPGLASEFGISTAAATQTLTLFLLGFSIGPMIFGPLSDRYGRKPILLFGVAVFALAALGCGLAQSLDVTLMLRFIGGVGAGAAASLPAAIVRDVYEDKVALSRQSMVALVNGVAPLVAPLLGAAVLAFGSWRAIHETLALLGLALFALAAIGYIETAPLAADNRKASVFAASMASYRAVLSDKNYLLSTALLASTFGVMFAYITGSSGVFMTALGATPTEYGMLFACTAAGTIAGASSNARLSTRFGSRRALGGAVVANVLIAALFVTVALTHTGSIPLCASLVVASNFCAGIIMPNATHQALRGLGHVAGSAAALQRGLQMVAGSAAGALVGFIGGDPLLSTAGVMLLAAAVAFASIRRPRSNRACVE